MRHLPWIGTLVAAALFLAADQVWHFTLGLRTYWPALIVVYCFLRYLVETRRTPEVR